MRTPSTSTATADVMREQPWYVQPRIVLPILTVLVVAATLFTPMPADDDDVRVTSHSTGTNGAALLYRLADRLGWEVARTEEPRIASDAATVHVLLSPVATLRNSEVRDILAHVRGGGGLLLALSDATENLADSLGVEAGRTPSFVDWRSNDDFCSPVTNERAVGFARVTQLLPVEWKRNAAASATATATATATAQRTTFLTVNRPSRRRGGEGEQPALVGVTLGRGRIVVAADPDIFRNDQLRNCELGFSFAVVRSLEWLRDGERSPRARLLFDEYRQGFGRQSGSLRTVREYLLGAPSGHTLLQLGVAGLVLLIAAAPRLVRPRDPVRLERRSPLEHVDALSRAYEQVGATRTATTRLVRGLRRRAERRATRGGTTFSDDAYLARLAELVPEVSADATLLRRALVSDLPRNEFPSVGQAVRRIEESLSASARL